MDACHDRWKGAVSYFATTYTLANYKQTGGGRPVRNLVHATGGASAILRYDLAHGTNDAYDGLDRFGRVAHLKWTNNSTTTHVELKYGHDYAGNRTWREDLKASVDHSEDFDEFYTYDGLHRLATLKRGELDGDPPTGIKSSSPAPTFTEDWTLDALGNWGTFKWDDDGTGGADELIQTRLHNKVNEIDNNDTHGSPSTAAITGTNCNWAEPQHDAAGNMTIMPNPKSLTADLDCTYDAWNRLVETEDDDTNTTSFSYDGLGRRITLTDSSSVVRHFYHNGQQVVEERVGELSTADR